MPGFRTKRKFNNNVEINGHDLLELEGDNNFSSSNRNAVIVNPQENNIVSKTEVINSIQQPIQLECQDVGRGINFLITGSNFFREKNLFGVNFDKIK